jgi:hypothetical protein
VGRQGLFVQLLRTTASVLAQSLQIAPGGRRGVVSSS